MNQSRLSSGADSPTVSSRSIARSAITRASASVSRRPIAFTSPAKLVTWPESAASGMRRKARSATARATAERASPRSIATTRIEGASCP